MQNLSDMQLLVEVWNYLERKKQVYQFYRLIPNTSSSGPFCSGCCSAVFEVRQRSRDDDDDDEEGEDEEQLELLQGFTPGGGSLPPICQEDEDEDGADDGDAISSLERNADKAKWIVESALGTSGPGIDGFNNDSKACFLCRKGKWPEGLGMDMSSSLIGLRSKFWSFRIRGAGVLNHTTKEPVLSHKISFLSGLFRFSLGRAAPWRGT